MAGLRGVKILLLWAGIIGLAKSQTPTVPDNAPTASPTTNHTKGPSPLTSPEVNPSNTTVDNTTPVRRSTAPPLECNYTVKTIKFGLKIDITSSAVNPVPTSIMIHEEGKPQTAARFSAPHSNLSSSHKIKQLKPCTKYEFNVILDDKDRPTPCERMTVNDSMTEPIMKEDIEEANCSSTSSKSVCYQSGWDISSLQTTPDMIPDLQCGNNTVCFKPGSDDICSIMTFNFSSKTCTSTSFQLDRNIKIRDFLDVKNINQTAPTQFPVKFETKLPPNCNLSIDYTCHIFYPRRGHYPELHGFNKAKNLSELEPFMDYKCIGLIKDKNNVNVYNTTEVKVRIDCDLKIDFTNTSTTNTSSQLTWTTTINRCKDVIQKLLFHCRCGDSYQRVWSSNQPSGGTCNITDLKPYRVSTCWVQPYYNYRRVGNSSSVKQKTEIGVPEDIDNLKLEVKDHNTIIVTCNHSQIFNGPEGIFKAQLHDGGSSVERNDETCEFEFKNLKYSTNYTVKVTAANSLFESNPVTKQISTEYCLDVKNINQTAPTQFPVEFKAELPPNCNLSIDYTCHVSYPRRDYYPWFDGFNETKNLSELEPFMDYECIGLIKDTNNVTVYNTTEVDVRIDCDLEIDFTITSTTNTSSQLTWTTTSNRCKDVIQNLPKLSYRCGCGDYRDSYQLGRGLLGFKQPSGGTCKITDLRPYRDYTCWVQPTYNRRDVGTRFSVQQKTEIGVPEDVHDLKLEVKDHNTIIVTCNHSQIFNGPERIFKAQLHDGGSSVERNDETCEFEFKNLKYSTNYTVKVTAVNRLFESNPITKQISTEYVNAGIGFHVFYILLTSVALLVVVYKIYDLRFRKSE
ncbi:receptor-type tyrosine-protein phosphatase C isoform X2 [Pleuronectes platessa]|uniref:receptor-type tyrosine-protein phosphatase C isoform X2 n=1 Tax=Pleuronectes platessa TaxID=8262 RepID=UPI00232A1F34|nr:receptor-type tyrosine-protein phosphatase C isoform X2 [Pleuronectes platessa]